jgi:hypothetical protein
VDIVAGLLPFSSAKSTIGGIAVSMTATATPEANTRFGNFSEYFKV